MLYSALVDSPYGATAADARVVFMGTPDFAVPTLRRLLARWHVVGVFTQPDRPAGRGRALRASPVKEVAEGAGVPVFQPKSLRRDPAAAEALADLAPMVIVVAAYGLILPPDVLALPPAGALNVHASLLPRWRGAAPVQHALLAGDEITGVAIMRMEEGLDTGPVLAMREVPTAGLDGGELTERLAVVGAELLAETLPAWLAGALVAEAQPDEGVTLAPRLTAADRVLDWQAPAVTLERRVRALAPRPGAHTTLQGGEVLKVLKAEVVAGPPGGAPGTLEAVNGVPVVRCGEGALLLQRVQPAGRTAMAGGDFLRGRPGVVGERLGAAATESPAGGQGE